MAVNVENKPIRLWQRVVSRIDTNISEEPGALAFMVEESWTAVSEVTGIWAIVHSLPLGPALPCPALPMTPVRGIWFPNKTDFGSSPFVVIPSGCDNVSFLCPTPVLDSAYFVWKQQNYHVSRCQSWILFARNSILANTLEFARNVCGVLTN